MSDSSVPQWAAFFNQERFDQFGEILAKALEEFNKPFVLNLTEGSLRVIGAEQGSVYGIVNLAQICKQVPIQDWPAVMSDFLGNLTKVHLQEDIPHDIETARPQLRIRMFVVENLDRSQMVTWPLTEDFVTCLTVDLPDKVLTVTQSIARTYGLSKDELYDVAMRNVVTATEFERHDIPVSDEAKVISFSGSSFFVASLSLALDHLLGPAPELGRLVAVPNRHNVMCAEIENAHSLDALGLLVQAARGMFVEGPGSISPYVYWVNRGGWHRLEVEITDEGLGVSGPDSFVERVLIPLLG